MDRGLPISSDPWPFPSSSKVTALTCLLFTGGLLLGQALLKWPSSPQLKQPVNCRCLSGVVGGGPENGLLLPTDLGLSGVPEFRPEMYFGLSGVAGARPEVYFDLSGVTGARPGGYLDWPPDTDKSSFVLRDRSVIAVIIVSILEAHTVF